MDGVADVLELLVEVPGDEGALVGVHHDVVEVEVALHAAQEHLELEELLLAALDGDAAQPALALGEDAGPRGLGGAHQVRVEVPGDAGRRRGGRPSRVPGSSGGDSYQKRLP